jgi:ATP-dependent DNA ligase
MVRRVGGGRPADLDLASAIWRACGIRETSGGGELLLRWVPSFFRVSHWVEPKLVVEITYLTWTADGLLRHTVYVGLREDKPTDQVRRDTARLS